jgi:ribosome-binding factor A
MKHKPPSQRQLKVGELIRHSLSKMFTRGEIPYLDGTSVTVSEVRVTPDLRHAVAYIYPLAGQNADKLLKALPAFAGFIRTYVAKEIDMRYAPRVSFKLDTSFEYASKISKLLQEAEAR